MARAKRGKEIEALINRQIRLWETMAQPVVATEGKTTGRAERFGPYVTLSRFIGTAGDEIARQVADRLGWQLFDREIVEYIASESRVRQEIVALFDEKVQSELHTWVENLLTFSSMDERHYLKKLSEVVYAIAHHGNAVIVGRGGNFIVPPRNGLRVRIVAPVGWRVEQLMQKEGLSEEEARRRIEASDAMQRTFVQRHFHRDIEDSTGYDLVLNVAALGKENCVDLIVFGIEKRMAEAGG